VPDSIAMAASARTLRGGDGFSRCMSCAGIGAGAAGAAWLSES